MEDTIARANRAVTLHSRDGKTDLQLSGGRVHFGTAGAAVSMVDPQGRAYRDSTVQDLHDAARICDQLDNIHFVQRPLVCRDISDNLEMDLNSIYATTSGTTKHVGVSFSDPAYVQPGLELLHMIAGGKDKWLERPFVSNSNCFVVPPMRFATESCQVMEECIRGGMPVLLLSAGHGWRHRAFHHCRSDRTGGRRMPGGTGLRKRGKPRCSSGFWNLALRP